MKTVTLKLNEFEVQALRKATLEWKKTMNNSYNFIVQNPINKWTGEKNHDLKAGELQTLHYITKATKSLHKKVLANTRSKI
tara:strand:+ start:184 stop:426 length:243 start_codon:yes stop_codon:yes gene_type:complete